MSALTIQEIRENAPAVFEDYPASTVNSKYKLIKTADMLEPMYDLGWYATDAQQRRTRQEDWQDKTYHFVRLRHDDFRVGDDNLEIIISNSHNATSAFKVQLGIYRLVCSNGLTSGTDLVSPLTLQHRGLSRKFMAEMTQLYASRMAESIADGVEAMKRTPITLEQVKQLAHKAAAHKHDLKKYEVDESGIYLPRRREDFEMNVWTQYNVIQENIINGTYQIKGKNGWRNARRVHSPASNILINDRMFDNAMELVS